MQIGSSRSDQMGFGVFCALVILLAVFVIDAFRTTGDASTEPLVGVQVAAEITAIPTTSPVTAPTATPMPMPTATPVHEPTPTLEPEAEQLVDTSNDQVLALSAAQAAQPQPTPEPTTPNPQPQATTAPNPQPKASDSGQTAPASVPAANPSGGTFTYTLTAKVSRPTLHTTAGGPSFTPTFNGTALPAVNPTVFNNPLVYRVLAGSPDNDSGWAQVYVPARSNGSTAWVQTSQFQWGSSNRMIRINVGNNTVTVFEGSNVLLSTQAVTGKSSSRTPIANGWVEEIMDGPSSAYGPRLISLGLFSNDLNSFGGQVPKIALHGTNSPGLMGQYASNGCIRVRNELITEIASLVQPGSKVEIVGA